VRVALLRAVRIIIRTDADPRRQVLFARLTRERLAARVAVWLHARLGSGRAATLLVSTYGLRAFAMLQVPLQPGVRLLTVAVHPNAKHQVNRVAAWSAPGTSSSAVWKAGAVLRFATLRAIGGMLADRRGLAVSLRIIGRCNRQHGFLVACRVASTIACYVRAHTILERQPLTVVVSSDNNPEELGFIAAAQVRGRPTVFIAHAHPGPLNPPLDFTLSLLEGSAALDARRSKGPVRGRVVLIGLEGDSHPMNTAGLQCAAPTVGLFPPKGVAWGKLARVIADCRHELGARAILIRWHPNSLDRDRLAEVLEDRSGVIETTGLESLADVARRCDFVIADPNSNVHLPVWKAGVPTIPLTGLGEDTGPDTDMYGFARSGMMPAPVHAIADLDLERLRRFYDAGWADRMSRFDAAYLRDAQTLETEARVALAAVANGQRQHG
jgi:hypothetical protein